MSDTCCYTHCNLLTMTLHNQPAMIEIMLCDHPFFASSSEIIQMVLSPLHFFPSFNSHFKTCKAFSAHRDLDYYYGDIWIYLFYSLFLQLFTFISLNVFTFSNSLCNFCNPFNILPCLCCFCLCGFVCVMLCQLRYDFCFSNFCLGIVHGDCKIYPYYKKLVLLQWFVIFT